VFQEARWFKNRWGRLHMGENKRGPGDLKELEAWAKQSGQEG